MQGTQASADNGSSEKTANGSLQAPSISLPKGGGALRGIGEKFSVNPSNGSASMSVPLFATPSRAKFYPQLTISYDSGSGNGAFGLGWKLSIPSITRKTDKGLPHSVSWSDPNLRMIDLDGDGFSDVLISEDEVFTWYQSYARKGFGPFQTVRKPNDEEQGPALVFADPSQSIYLADMTGDGLADIVRIRDGEICYWMNLGFGRFSRKALMVADLQPAGGAAVATAGTSVASFSPSLGAGITLMAAAGQGTGSTSGQEPGTRTQEHHIATDKGPQSFKEAGKTKIPFRSTRWGGFETSAAPAR